MILTSPVLLSKPLRIISLVPSQTELLYSLGLDEETIAITKFCIHPEVWFRNKIRIGGTKAIDTEKIIGLEPDLVIANKEENVKEQINEIAAHVPVWVTDVNDLNEALQMISDIGQLTHKPDIAEDLVASIRNKFETLAPVDYTIPVAYLIWKGPYMTVGGDTFINAMLGYAGMKNVFRGRNRYPEVTIQQIRSSGCKMLLLSSEPYPFNEKHIAELSEQLPGIAIRLVNGEMFSWYGSRLLESAEYFKSWNPEMVNG